jgi:hypothetical protein
MDPNNIHSANGSLEGSIVEEYAMTEEELEVD